MSKRGSPGRAFGRVVACVFLFSSSLLVGSGFSAGDPESATDRSDLWLFSQVPTGRFEHLAVWTGQEMIIWGGQNSTSPPWANGGTRRDGWRYNPLLNQWSEISELEAPNVSYFASAFWTGEEMLVVSGQGQGARYRPADDTWAAINTNGAPRASYPAVVWTGSEVLVWSGIEIGGVYDPRTDLWRPISTEGAPEARTHPLAVWTGNEMLIVGGFRDNALLSDGGRYNPKTDKWAPLRSAPVTLNAQGWRAISTGKEMIVWGPGDFGAEAGRGFRYDPVSNTWSAIASAGAPPFDNNYPRLVWTGTEMLVWGAGRREIVGISYGNPVYGLRENRGARYNPITDTWRSMSSTNAPAGRSGHSAVWTGAEMLVWGGTVHEEEDNCCETPFIHELSIDHENGGRYDLVNDRWTPIGRPERLTPRVLHTAVWTGNKVLIWGGAGYFLGAIKYDPFANKVSPIQSPPIEERVKHSSVWTGEELIIWGGFHSHYGAMRLCCDPSPPNQFYSLGDGMRYDLQSDRWLPMSSANAPSARGAHSAVWTGKEMIVWGGGTLGVQGGSPATWNGDGFRYDPQSNRWSSISTNGAPSARWDHSAVWTGREMIVWGGKNSSTNRLQDGGRYDPQTDSWKNMAQTGSPSASATAIWTGQEMIIWGGNGLREGALYNPETDTWRPMSVTDAPSARGGYSAVWTGREMIIWGGAAGTNILADGARYDPAADRWLALTSVNAPGSRVDHVAVWTGDAMVITGGTSSNGIPRYNFPIYRPLAPELTIGAEEAGKVKLVWPHPSTGFRLMESGQIDTGWRNVAFQPEHHDSNWVAELVSTNTAFFYLRSLPSP